jgi:membrane protease YdiL (CAAX protease family)
MGDGPQGNSRVLTWLVVAVVFGFPTLLTLADFVWLAPTTGTANPAQQVAYCLGKVVQVTLPVAGTWLLERRLVKLRRPTFGGLEMGLAFGLVVLTGMLVLYYVFLRDLPAFAVTGQTVRDKLVQFGVDSPFGFAAHAVFVCVAHSLLEEYYWRWFVFDRLRRLVPWVAALVISSLGFMSHHVVILAVYFPGEFWTAAVPFSLCVAAGGIAWGWLYQRTGSVWSPWLSHAIVDAGLFVVGYDLFFVRGG